MALFDKVDYTPPSGDRWDFDNPKHKKRLTEILAERDGFWCKFCGSTSALSIHHIRPRGQVSANAQVVDETTGEIFFRDDPRNLCFLCIFMNPIIHKKALIGASISCHDWVHLYPIKAKEAKLLIEPKFFATKKEV